MYAYITISNVGADAGPFDLYSDVDGYTSAFETNIPKALLEAGYATSLVPAGTTIIKIQSVNSECNNFVNVGVLPLEYYFTPNDGSSYVLDFVNSGTYGYAYGYFNGYYNGSSLVPGNHVVKLNSDRSVDTSFDIDEGPEFHTVFLGASITELPDLSIIFGGFYLTFNGETVNRILKLLPDGSRDPNFDSGTGFNNFVTNVQVDTSGRFYVLGLFNAYDGSSVPRGMVRLFADGSLDTTYNSGGVGFNNTSIFGIVNPDNSIIVSGYFTIYNGSGVSTGIVKLDENGAVSPDFNGGTGFNVVNGQPVSITQITGESSFYAAGYFTQYNGNPYPYIVKLTQTGAVDPSLDAVGTGFDAPVFIIKNIWGDKLWCYGSFTSYNGVPSPNYIVLNSDGSVFWAAPESYYNVYVIGNDLFGMDFTTNLNELRFTFDPTYTTTTTTTV